MLGRGAPSRRRSLGAWRHRSDLMSARTACAQTPMRPPQGAGPSQRLTKDCARGQLCAPAQDPDGVAGLLLGPEARGSLQLVPPHTARKPAAAKRKSRSPQTGRAGSTHVDPPNLGANGRLKIWLGVFLLGGLCLAAATFLVGPSESRSRESPQVAERDDGLGATRTVTGKYDRGFGWEEARIDFKLVGARAKEEPDESAQTHSTGTGRLITARFRVRNRSPRSTEEYPEFVAVDNSGRQFHPGPERPSLDPSLARLRVPSRGRAEGYLSVEVPDERRIERLALRLFGESLEWQLDRPL
jgi:hypothetical protein